MAKSRIAEAYVQIVPTMSGAQSAIADELATAGTTGADAFQGNFTKGLAGIAGAVGAAFAVSKVAAFTGQLVDAAQAEVEQNARIQNIAESMGLFGSNTDSTVQRLIDFASQQQLQNGLDEDAIKLTQAKLLTFKNIASTAGDMGGMFDRATMAAQDLAAAGFGSAESNAVALGKALNDPIKGVTALSRMGVTFSEDQKAMIQSMVDTGDIAGAQAAIMAELERQVGGTAVAITTNSDKLDQSWGNLQETLGLALLPVVESFAGVIKPIADWFANTPGAAQALIIVLGTFTAIMAALAAVFLVVTIQTWAMNAALLANPVVWIVLAIVAAIGLLVAAVVLIVSNWDAVVQWLQSVFGPVFEWLGGIFTWLYESIVKPVFDAIAAVFGWIYTTIIQPIIQAVIISVLILGAIFSWLYDTIIKPVFDAIGAVFAWLWDNVISPTIGWIGEKLDLMGKGFKLLYESFIKPAFDSIGQIFDWIWKTIIKPTFDTIGSAVESVGKTFKTVFQGVHDFFRDVFVGIARFMREPINAIVGIINSVIDAVNGIKIDIPEWARGFFGGASEFSLSIPRLQEIPALAAGGLVTQPTTALIGEAGPEVVTPLKDFERMMGIGKNGNGQTINYYAAPNQSLDAEQALTAAVQRARIMGAW